MTKERVIWTTLPNGVGADKRLQITLFVSPRLSNADGSDTIRKLGEFPAFAEWPTRLAGLEFKVEFQGGASAAGAVKAVADAKLWKHLLPPDTPVVPYVFRDHAKRNLHVFPVRGVHTFLKGAYGALGAAGTDLPSIDDPAGPLAPFGALEHLTTLITDSSSFYEELERSHQSDKEAGRVVEEHVADSGLSPVEQAAQNHLFQAYRFYYRPGSQHPGLPLDYVEPSPAVPELDFHRLIAQLGDHPALLRRLGLLVDLVVELDDPVSQVPATGVVRVIPDGDLPEKPPICPGTRYELDKHWFGAKAKNPDRTARGLLRINPDLYDLIQVDVDGAALQVTDFANTLGRHRDPNRRGPATPDAVGVPALRSAGLSLARNARGQQLLDDLVDRSGKNALIESGATVLLDAEDLVRGYRVDVHDADAPDGARWFSLNARAVEYEFTAPAGATPPKPLKISDEGYVKGTSASGERADHPSASDDLYLHENVFGWEGWSLVAPRPGKRIVEPGEGDAGTSIARYDPAASTAIDLVTRTAVTRGTLPRLRIGHRYRMRARTVDLAGNSRPFSEKDLEPKEKYLVSEEQTYRRFEPLPSPAVLRRHLDTEGESLEHLVIRSNLGISAADYAASPEVKKALADIAAPYVYAEDSQRHLAPPKASQLMAEQHSRFDAAFGGSAAAVTAALRTSLREEGTFLDETIVDITSGQKTIAQSTISIHPSGTPLPPVRGAGLPDGAYAYYPDTEVLLPYLPDPLAIGVSLTGYDFDGTELFHLVAPFPGDWPTLDPFRLRLSEGALGAKFTAGVLEVTLPKSYDVRARLASVFSKDHLGDFAIWDWIPPPGRTAPLEKAARAGRHWMLSPFRWVTFTHAVQQPLEVPDMTKVVVGRGLGETYASFRGPIVNDARSSGRLDVFGEWTEDIDLLTDDAPRMRALGTEVHHQAHAFGFDIGPGEDSAQVTNDARTSRHEFGDTKYRRIVYHSVATTRFREFLPRPIADDPSRIQRVESTSDQQDGEVAALVRHVPNAARPAAPDVVYVLPTFRWERQDEGDHRVHVRRGKSVRVWMRRPWFSSGDGEQLGVVLKPGVRLPPKWRMVDETLALSALELARRTPSVSTRALSAVRERTRTRPTPTPIREERLQAAAAGPSLVTSPAAAAVSATAVAAAALLGGDTNRVLDPYITRWGSDPVWKSKAIEQPPTVAAFPRHTGYATGLSLDELRQGLRVNVAAHDVLYHSERKLWYCDIEIDPGDTYYPFVRLALARYQPHSLANAHLSRVVMTDFIQIAPDRHAQIDLSGGAAGITVTGYSGRNIVADLAGHALGIPELPLEPPTIPNTAVRAALERRVPGVPGDLGWERIGKEITLSPGSSGFHVTWTGSLNLPEGYDTADGESSYRIVIVEVETHLRDYESTDPGISTSPADFVRERVVYADTFDI